MRWFVVSVRVHGRTITLGKVFCTTTELRNAVGAYATINPENGDCLIYSSP